MVDEVGLLHQVKAILTLAWINGILALVRLPLWFFYAITMPLSFLALLAILVPGGVGFKLGIVGGLIWTIFSSSLAVIGDAAYYRLEVKFQHMIVTSPTSPLAYALGIALSEIFFTLPGLIIFIALLAISGYGLREILLCVIHLMALWYSTSMISFYISTLFGHMRYTWAIVGILSTLLGVLPPVYYPAVYLGSLWWIAYLSPPSTCAMILHDVFSIVKYGHKALMIAHIVEALWCAIGSILALKFARWRSK